MPLLLRGVIRLAVAVVDILLIYLKHVTEHCRSWLHRQALADQIPQAAWHPSTVKTERDLHIYLGQNCCAKSKLRRCKRLHSHHSFMGKSGGVITQQIRSKRDMRQGPLKTCDGLARFRTRCQNARTFNEPLLPHWHSRPLGPPTEVKTYRQGAHADARTDVDTGMQKAYFII